MKKITLGQKKDSIIEGVCAGIAEYFNIDPFWIRILFIILFGLSLSGLWIYIACLIILPRHTKDF